MKPIQPTLSHLKNPSASSRSLNEPAATLRPGLLSKPANLPHLSRITCRGTSITFVLAAFLGLGAIDAHAGTILWSNTGGTSWLTGTNWTGNATPGTTDVAQFGANPTTATGLGISMSSPTNNGTANQAVGAIEVTSARTSGGVTIGDSSTTSAGTLTLNGATVNGVNDVILRNGSSVTLTLQPTQGTGTQNMSVALADSTANIVNVDGSGNIVISSNISGTSKSLTVNASSTVDLRLSGTNSWDGGTNITGGSAGGKLRVDAVAALPTTGTVAVSTGGRMTLNVAGTYGGTTQALTFSPNQTANPSLDILSGAAVTWQGTVALNGDTRIEANGAAGSLTFSGNASGSGALIKQAAGNLILSGAANTLTGATQIGNGTLTVNGGSAMGTGGLTLFQTGTNNTALTLNNSTQTVGSLASQFTATTGSQTQTITLNGTALTVNQSNDGIYGTGAVATLTSTITGTGSLTKSGTAQLTLGSANTYTGTTAVTGGTLKAAAAAALGSTSGITVHGGGTLLLNGGGNDKLNNAATFTLNGGTLNLGGISEGAAGTTGIGALLLSANSTLDFGTTGGSNVVQFGGIGTHAASTTLSVLSYEDGADHLFFAGNALTAFTNTFAQSDVSFNGLGGYSAVQFGGYFEVVPVPEPATVFGALSLVAFVGWRERRRFATLPRKTASL